MLAELELLVLHNRRAVQALPMDDIRRCFRELGEATGAPRLPSTALSTGISAASGDINYHGC